MKQITEKSLFVLLFFAAAPVFLFPGVALSEVEAGRADVHVQVRTIQATGLLTNRIADGREGPRAQEAALSVDRRIEDIAPKLAKLHYASYRLIGLHEKVVPVRRRETIQLANGHSLTVRCLYTRDQRVGMWIKWRDASGMEVLDTRMHLDLGESMITGTDGHSETGMILAISASAVEN